MTYKKEMNTSPSELNKRITWQQQTKVADGQGGFTVTWVDVATTWAAIWPISANEVIQSDKPTMTVSHRVRIRFRNVFKPEWRGIYGNKIFNIVSVINVNTDSRWLDVLCKEVQ